MTNQSKAFQLTSLTMKQLESVIANENLPVTVNKSKTKSRVVKEILAAYAAREVDSLPAVPYGGNLPRPVNDALEKLLTPGSALPENGTLPANEETEKVENRGGARPGAGRPKGMTAARARMTHLSECPHPAVLGLLNGLFESWSVAAGCPEVALTKDEAFDLALPWTNVLEYWGVTDYIPVWIELAITCTWNTWSLIKAKTKLAQAKAEERKQRGVKLVHREDEIGTWSEEVKIDDIETNTNQ